MDAGSAYAEVNPVVEADHEPTQRRLRVRGGEPAQVAMDWSLTTQAPRTRR